jgi:hypothetical protein
MNPEIPDGVPQAFHDRFLSMKKHERDWALQFPEYWQYEGFWYAKPQKERNIDLRKKKKCGSCGQLGHTSRNKNCPGRGRERPRNSSTGQPKKLKIVV